MAENEKIIKSYGRDLREYEQVSYSVDDGAAGRLNCIVTDYTLSSIPYKDVRDGSERELRKLIFRDANGNLFSTTRNGFINAFVMALEYFNEIPPQFTMFMKSGSNGVSYPTLTFRIK